VPVLAALILKPKEEKDTFILRHAKRFYLPLLDWALDHKKPVIGGALALLGVALAVFPFLGKEFMPTCRRARSSGSPASFHLAGRESRRVQRRHGAQAGLPQVTSTLATIGRAEKGETADVNYMEVLVDLKPRGMA
jgi:cobalt-zinc-cadmium resistance protein CzcA